MSQGSVVCVTLIPCWPRYHHRPLSGQRKQGPSTVPNSAMTPLGLGLGDGHVVLSFSLPGPLAFPGRARSSHRFITINTLLSRSHLRRTGSLWFPNPDLILLSFCQTIGLREVASSDSRWHFPHPISFPKKVSLSDSKVPATTHLGELPLEILISHPQNSHRGKKVMMCKTV